MTQRKLNHPRHGGAPDTARRAALGALGAVGAASLAACRSAASKPAPVAGSDATAAASRVEAALANASTAACVITAVETAGPFPLVSVLDNPALVRRDITEGKTGIPLTLTLKIVDHDKACAALSGAAVYPSTSGTAMPTANTPATRPKSAAHARGRPFCAAFN